MSKARISILDGFRAIAVLSVLLYHFFSRWTPPRSQVSLYPYHGEYDYFGYGYLGVQFFFVISGFVIFFTLENTTNFSLFWKKRMIRLLPSIIVASIITFTVMNLFDKSNIFSAGKEIKNFIPSLTFFSPDLLNNIFSKYHPNLEYISGVYWSLWPEIQFYFLASTVFYICKKKFINNFIIIVAFITAVNYLIKNIQGSNQLHISLPESFLAGYSKWIPKGFPIIEYLPFFCLGVLFYHLFKNHRSNIKTPVHIKVFLCGLIMYMIYAGVQFNVRVAYILIMLLFFAFIYFPKQLSLFENKTLTNIGESSYFTYLIHDDIGVLIIYSFGNLFLPYGYILPLLMIVLMIVLSKLYTDTIDSKISRWLKTKLITNAQHSPGKKPNKN